MFWECEILEYWVGWWKLKVEKKSLVVVCKVFVMWVLCMCLLCELCVYVFVVWVVCVCMYVWCGFFNGFSDYIWVYFFCS